MKFQHPFLTTIGTIFLFFSLFLLFFFLLGRCFFSRENLEKFFKEFDYITYLKEQEEIQDLLEEKKVPEEVFYYIPKQDFLLLVEKELDYFYEEKKTPVTKEEISSLFQNSISIYEKKHVTDIYPYLKDDLDTFSQNLVASLHEEEMVSAFSSIAHFLSQDLYYYIFLLLPMIFATIFLFLERWNGLFVTGVSFLVFSFFLYYVKTSEFDGKLSSLFLGEAGKLFYPFMKPFLVSSLDPVFLFMVIVGIFSLLGYMIYYLRKVYRTIRYYY